MLGALLFVGQQFDRQGGVLLRCHTTLARAGDRPHRDAFALEADQNLRRGADDVVVLEIEIEHVGRRVQAAQRAVERQRAGAERLGHALREHDLHDVALGNVILGLAHGLLESGLAEHRHGRLGIDRLFARQADRRAQFLQQFLEARPRLLVGTGEARFGINDQRQLARQVVDDGDFLGEQQADVRRADFIRIVGPRQARLDIAHGVVAEAADQAAAEARQAARRRHPEALHVVADEVERIGVVLALGDAVAGQHQHLVAIDDDARRCRQADDRIAPETLAALH